MRTFARSLIILGLLYVLAACQNGPLAPTPTAIPLAATATSAPRSSVRPSQMPTSTGAPPPTATSRAKPSPTATIPASDLSAQLDNRLARQTVQGFLTRLAAGNTESASNLYLTDSAREGEPGRLLDQVSGSAARLENVSLVAFLWISDTAYEAQAELHWAENENGAPATQMLTLALAYERGLWLIDDMSLNQARVIAATPTSRPAAGTGRRTPGLDGKLVFQVSSGGDIYVINADGSGLDRVTDGLDPAWSPDGTQIAFTRWRHPWGVYLVDQSGEERIVDSIRLKGATWSPTGTKLAFAINYSSSETIEICFFGFCFTIPPYSFGQIWTVDLETGEMLNLPLDDQAVHAPAWSPKDNRIIYAGDRGLAWIDLDSMEKDRFEGSSVWDASPAFSPDGQRIALMGRVHDRWEIFVMNADGSGRQQLTQSAPRIKAPPSNVAPTWSPDGRQIAFLSNRDGPWRIYVMNADGSRQRSMFGNALDGLGFRYEWATERVISWSD